MPKKTDQKPLIYSLFFLILLVSLAAFYKVVTAPKVSQTAVMAPSTGAPTPDPSLIVGPFTGQLPCADCSGITASLTLVRDSQGADMGTFTYTQTYEGKSVAPYVSTGSWTVLRGDKTNPNATVYQITDKSDNSNQYFLKQGDNQIKMLSNDLGSISGPGNYTFTKQMTVNE